jgi:Transmembrane amino acid transporter protein
MMKAVLITLVLFTSAASAIQIPSSWVATGYEKFKDPPENRRRAPWIKKEEVDKVDEVEKKPEPSAVSKAILGIGAACAVAAIGGSILGEASSKSSAERSLINAVKKRVVLVQPVDSGGASILNEVLNLVKAIVGVGVLSLPAGVAAFGSAPSAFIPAAILIAVMGILSGFGFSLIGRVCAYTGARSYREAWSRSVGHSTSWIPAWSTTCKTFLACLAYSMVLGDTFSNLLETERNETLLFVTLIILTPLCLKRDLKSLAPYSLLGVLGMAFTALAMTVRYTDGSYDVAGDSVGSLVAEVSRYLRPRFGEQGVASVLSPNALILVCMLSTAYMVRFSSLLGITYRNSYFDD